MPHFLRIVRARVNPSPLNRFSSSAGHVALACAQSNSERSFYSLTKLRASTLTSTRESVFCVISIFPEIKRDDRSRVANTIFDRVIAATVAISFQSSNLYRRHASLASAMLINSPSIFSTFYRVLHCALHFSADITFICRQDC